MLINSYERSLKIGIKPPSNIIKSLNERNGALILLFYRSECENSFFVFVLISYVCKHVFGTVNVPIIKYFSKKSMDSGFSMEVNLL